MLFMTCTNHLNTPAHINNLWTHLKLFIDKIYCWSMSSRTTCIGVVYKNQYLLAISGTATQSICVHLSVGTLTLNNSICVTLSRWRKTTCLLAFQSTCSPSVQLRTTKTAATAAVYSRCTLNLSTTAAYIQQDINTTLIFYHQSAVKITLYCLYNDSRLEVYSAA